VTSVQTVRGAVPVAEFGVALVHEHLLCELSCYWDPASAPGLAASPVDPAARADLVSAPFASFDNLALRSLDEAAAGLRRFAAAGGRAVLELSSQGIGRQPRALRWLAEATGVHIVAGCGYYIAASHPPGLAERGVDSVTAELVRDIDDGIGDTGVRAGVIGEIGVGSWPPHPAESVVLEASARAQARTGVPVVIHSPPERTAIGDYADHLLRLGFDPARTVLAHLDVRLRDDVAAYVALARAGFRLGLDTFGRDAYYPQRGEQHPSDDLRVATVIALLAQGLEEHVLLSQDICFRHELTEQGGVGYHHVLDRIVPRLVACGVPREQCDRLLTANVARLFS
jgi:phosphotriesterase-related protein